ncbi:MAG: HPr(Ser) kinase/phosphatase [Gemmatimonadetes bacterium]|jgi:HPr kinase/phosphorylase|nr:HPr(Ser) kinase/phosphatase [Gemmatimonadota bacterium]MBP6443955.1 HPr(Ser) kinase/phosphatase [Gemmatimonadales bacterium]MBK9549007.1 HPr(Ser) kinase/phosphatase [Gemmatimonadota bacterium]MBP6571992.1 HPr(Ser) kinase/phosphatase [Gemmatimonadales bacterium]MBP7622069.1 HPr(Ser) kinase/phosphatase [Gemmatimonadales bacterium]
MRFRDFLAAGDTLQLEPLTGELGLDRLVPDAEIASPGLALAGYHGRFMPDRLHVLGETEISYLASLTAEVRTSALEGFFQYDLPCVFITKGMDPPEPMLDLARGRHVPVLRTRLKTAEFYKRIKPMLEDAFAPRTTLHGSLSDVYGVGLLFVGRSGIGKSECVLDLVERGHRLVADDVVKVTRRGTDVLLGQGHELAAHHMEIRGVGLIDIPALFGARSVRQQKRIEVIVQLEDWETAQGADRTGLQRDTQVVLDVPIPKVIVPLNPGKNITVIAEVVAMMHLLRYSGVDVAAAFNERLIKKMREKRGVREYLRDDFE